MAFKINCRCQPKCVVNLIKDFDDSKKVLVRQIGFNGILDFKLTKVNRQFGAWLLSKVDTEKSAIVLGNKKVIPFSSKHVSLVFGLPCTGKSIDQCSLEDVVRCKRYLCEIFEVLHFSKVTISFLEGILKNQYSHPLTSEQKRSFKAAFVLYVMTKLLAPQSLANNISTRYIQAVSNVDNIGNYNWSQFIVDDLKKCVDLMPKRFPKSSQGSISGCILFLQTIYLDNLDFGKDDVLHDTYPRICDFHDDSVGKMIQADTMSKKNPGYPFPRYGKLKLRDVSRIIYTTMHHEFDKDEQSSVGTLFSNKPSNSYISQFVKSHFKSKKNSAILGTEAQGLINEAVANSYGEFMSILDDMSDFINISDNKTVGEALQRFKIVMDQTALYVLKIAVKATLRNVIGVSEQNDSHNSNSSSSAGNCSLNSMHSNAGTNAQQNNPTINMLPLSTPTKIIDKTDLSNSGTQSISPGLGTRMSNQCKILLLEEFGNDDCKRRKYTMENPPSHILKEKTKRTIKPNKKLLSPFVTKHCPQESHDARVANALYSYITSTSDMESLGKVWLKSSYPFCISLTLRNLQETLAMNGQMDSDCLNFAIRKMYRTEVERFHNTNYLGWRHFVNQDFGLYAVAGEEFWEPTHQLAHFTGPEIVYDVSDCHMPLHTICFRHGEQENISVRFSKWDGSSW